MKQFYIKLISITLAVIVILNVFYNLFFAENINKISSILSLSETSNRMELRDKFREESKPGAEFNVKWFILKDALLEKAEISINNDDLDNEIDKIVKESNEDEKKIRDFFSDDNNKSSLASNLLNDRLFTHISEFSVIKDKEKSTSELRKQT